MSMILTITCPTCNERFRALIGSEELEKSFLIDYQVFVDDKDGDDMTCVCPRCHKKFTPIDEGPLPGETRVLID